MAMGTSWASGTWATGAWATGTWAGVGAGGSEALGSGDLTTQFAIWLRTVAPDTNRNIRARLNTEYGTSNPDLTTLVTRFLKERT